MCNWASFDGQDWGFGKQPHIHKREHFLAVTGEKCPSAVAKMIKFTIDYKYLLHTAAV